MVIRRLRKGLPRKFRNHPAGRRIIFEKDLRVGSSRLRCKLVVFANRKDLRDFWQAALHPKGKSGRLGRYCDGVVNPLFQVSYTVSDKGKEGPHVMKVDPRYYAIIGIVRRRLGSAEVHAHEAVHAGFAYARRVKRTPWDDQKLRNNEEAIAYPAGKIARELADIFWKHFHKS